MRSDDIDQVVGILKKETRRWPVPALEKYLRTPFTVLISCILSLRTQDKTTTAASERLFAVASDPLKMLDTPVEQIEQAIYPVAFYRVKARTIHRICDRLLSRFAGSVPAKLDDLLSLPGVGRKTANIVVTLGFRKPGIAVDTHVHRICNRLGYVRTRTADETELALRKKLPARHWIVLNALFVVYGQNLCRPISPFCSKCKIAEFCRRVNVGISR